MRRWLFLSAPALVLLALFLSTPSDASHSVIFTHGVASGDVTPISAVLWTRVDQEAGLRVQVSTNPAFPLRNTRTFRAAASADNDFTAKVIAAPLIPNRTYFYRWVRGPSMSQVGEFKTAPLPFRPADARFAFSGDSDGTKVGGVPFFNNFEVLAAIGAENPDFWVYLGDTIYSDSGLRAAAGLGGPAMTLQEYRDTYKVNREYANLLDLLKSTSTYAIWDDHEVQNDFDGQTVDPARFANGREAFLEYMPMLELHLPDPGCADDPLFRAFRWGKDVDVIVLDERSCRSADVTAACLVQLGPGVFQPDLAPTLPTFLRVQFGALLPPPLNLLLQPSPPAGCLAAINDPSRTMLGDVQKTALKAILEHSNAKFKFIVNEVPIQQFYALPYDRWEGYGAERSELLNFIRTNSIDNVAFLTTDTHANLINEVFVDRFADPAPIADEFVTGPIATNTFEAEIRAFFGGGPLGDLGVLAFNQILTIVGVDCRDLDANSYGLVDVDASAGTATVTLKDDTGATLVNQTPPAVPCTKTLGP